MEDMKEIKEEQPVKEDQPVKEQAAKSKSTFKDNIKETVTKMSDKVKKTLEDLHDIATLEIRLPVGVRMRHRYDSIKKMGQAKTIKIDGHHITRPPQFHMTGLTRRIISEELAEIRFQLYETWDKDGVDETGEPCKKGEKKPTYQFQNIQMPDGTLSKKVTNAQYRIVTEVVEKIPFRQPIQRETLKLAE